MSLIEARDVSVVYGPRTVLHGIDLTIEEREIVTVVGPNGSGKSTLLRVLIQALTPDTGRVRHRAGLRIGYVPQRLDLDATLPLTVERFMSLPGRPPRGRIRESLARTGAGELRGQAMSDLSGGQFQRVLLARALAVAPDVLVLDEPTQGLDQPGIADLYALIAEASRDLGCAVLMVSHDLHVVMRASDRVICLNGHICCQGAPTSVLAAPEYRALFGTEAGALALYRHEHDHSHDGPADHGHAHGNAAPETHP